MSDAHDQNAEPSEAPAPPVAQPEAYAASDGGGGGDGEPPRDRPDPPFITDGESRVGVVATPNGGVVVRPGEWTIDLTAADLTVAEALELLGGDGVVTVSPEDERRAGRLGVLRVDVADEEALKKQLAGLTGDAGAALRAAVRRHVVFLVGGLTAAPMHLSPMHLSPMHLSPMHLSPMHLSGGVGGDPSRFWNSSTARPVPAPTGADANEEAADPDAASALVAVLDTGLSDEAIETGSHLSDVMYKNPGGDLLVDRADVNGDQYLDIAAGHSVFIRTIIERAAPGTSIRCLGVMANDGDGDEADVADALLKVFDNTTDEQRKRLIVNLSFGGYYHDDVEPPMVAAAIRKLTSAGAVIVAAAGNDGDCRKKFPAAMSEVVGVAALGPCGPAPFSNHGPWVQACAPGVDLVSRFFAGFNGAFTPIDASIDDIDDFKGWAMWSGTSFATPAVVGALAHAMQTRSLSAQQAVDYLIRRPGLYRIPDYGVVVNRIF